MFLRINLLLSGKIVQTILLVFKDEKAKAKEGLLVVATDHIKVVGLSANNVERLDIQLGTAITSSILISKNRNYSNIILLVHNHI